MKNILTLLITTIFCFSCTYYDTKVDFKELIKRYMTIDEAICLYEKPYSFDKSYKVQNPSVLGYACFKLKNKPNLKDFKLEEVSELSMKKDGKLFKDSQAALLHIISKSEDSEAKVAFLNFIEKYHDNMVFIYRNSYPLILEMENDKTTKFVFYGVIFSPLSEIVYCILLYYP